MRIHVHTHTHTHLQSFRSQLTNKQPEIDAMLALGRAVIAEPTTNPQNESFPKKLTSFIEDLADLQLAYQNWYDELHRGLQQSKNLSEQLGKFASVVNGLEPACNNLFPATVTMENLEPELKTLQVGACIKRNKSTFHARSIWYF